MISALDKSSLQIIKASSRFNISVQTIPNFYNTELYKYIEKKYIKGNNGRYLWENFRYPSSIKLDNGWSFIKYLVKNDKFYMFFNKADDENAVLIPSGEYLDLILKETYNFEFYITDTDLNYIVCYNHHDCLICSGNITHWLNNIRNSKNIN